jgi:TRAP-type C4-dicarboxylate transport system substrate-binding protein
MINSGGSLASGVFMNLKTFKGLPADTQKTLLDLRREYGAKMAQKQMDDEAKYFNEWKTKYGVLLKELTAEERKLNTEAVKKAQEYMLKKQESDGHGAVRKVWDQFIAARKKYEDERAKKK